MHLTVKVLYIAHALDHLVVIVVGWIRELVDDSRKVLPLVPDIKISYGGINVATLGVRAFATNCFLCGWGTFECMNCLIWLKESCCCCPP